METKNTQKVIDFVTELMKALEDKKITTGEAFGLVPETLGLLSALKEYPELMREMSELNQLSPAQLKAIFHFNDNEKFEAIFDLAMSFVNCIEVFNHK